MMSLYQDLKKKETSIAVVGLGYVGLPLAVEFGKRVRVIGFDVDEKRVKELSCGVGANLIQYTVDLSPHKQGHLLPGSRIPIFSPEKIQETKPDYVLILPWNLKEEIMKQMAHVRQWGSKFVTPIPELRILE